MNETTRYRYEQRIKNLSAELDKAKASRDIYRGVLIDICDALCTCTTGQHLDNNWIHKQFKRLWRYP